MKYVRIWLYFCALMCVVMVFIGGYTRLSHAGLSIVEWKPISGVIPPLSENAWIEEFDKYKTSPEYQKINNNITLETFQEIFWIEFIHRFVARLTGVIILLPLIYFYFSGVLSLKSDKSYLTIPILLFVQAFMGWYMVKSGLVIDPKVSHFRLSMHFILAMLLYSNILWKLYSPKLPILGIISVCCVFIQMFFGGLVAGLKAGLIYNTFPLMGGSFIPSEFLRLDVIDILNDPASVQFLHRTMAYIVAIICLCYAFRIKKNNPISCYFIIIALCIQIFTGITTLIFMVPMSLALIHQICAMFLLTSLYLQVVKIK